MIFIELMIIQLPQRLDALLQHLFNSRNIYYKCVVVMMRDRYILTFVIIDVVESFPKIKYFKMFAIATLHWFV